MADPCTYLDWDSAFFGKRIARVNGSRLTDAEADAALTWCAEQRIDCLYFLADSDDGETVRAVEARGFAFVDIRMTLERTGAVPPAVTGIRPSRTDDLPALKAMARAGYRDSRFYYDPHFSPAQADAMYEIWIEKNYETATVLVAERDGQVSGYVSCEPNGTIGLLGVGEAWRGQGIGTALVNGALAWFGSQGTETVSVVTQGRNVGAQRIYQRCGFVTAQVQLWYHRWFEAAAGAERTNGD